MFQGSFYREQKFIKVVGFGNKIVSAEFYAIDGFSYFGIGGENNNLNGWIIFFYKFKDILSLHDRHFKIKKKEVVIFFLHVFDGIFTVVNHIN